MSKGPDLRLRILGFLVLFAFGSAQLELEPVDAAAATEKTPLKPFNVTVRVFDPAKGLASGQDYVLPVDSPDAEHAASSTMANAVSFTKKIDDGKARSVAFTCVKVEPR